MSVLHHQSGTYLYSVVFVFSVAVEGVVARGRHQFTQPPVFVVIASAGVLLKTQAPALKHRACAHCIYYMAGKSLAGKTVKFPPMCLPHT